MPDFIKKLNHNKVFKFISSIRLAVPLMLILGVCVAYGTIIESNYNAEYAAMTIYKSTWFGALIILLWINIFCATISRIPFKLHHLGFVVTHIGLLTLLIGGYLTNNSGIDGQLVIAENQSSSTVSLPNLMIGFQFEGSPSPQIVKFNKTIYEQNQNQLRNINDSTGFLFTVKKYIPFAKVEKEYIENPQMPNPSVALSFILKSNFFNVNEWLHSEKNPVMKMGPATLKIVKIDDLNQKIVLNEGLQPSKPSKIKTKQNKRIVNSVSEKNQTDDSFLVLTNIKNTNEVKKIKVSDLIKNTQTYKGVQIKLIQFYKNAVVAQNKMTEGDNSSNSNPALEISIEKNGKTLREVLYAKFAGFSLNPDGAFDYKFSFEASGVESTSTTPHGETATTSTSSSSNSENPAAPADHPAMTGKAEDTVKGDNTVIFSVDPKEKNKARLTLIKNNEVVMSEILTEGQSLQTPWMGMKIFLGSVKTQATERFTAQPINPEKSAQLPPSALLISTSGPQDSTHGEEFWLAEGEQKETLLAGKKTVIYFGRQTIELPFELKLQKFSKLDYPGTTTPMSYESQVEIGNTGVVQKISMNEPLKLEGFTIYQASYSISPEQTLSIFSVNKDPGRELKYFGSLILGLGIIIITLMRSRVWKNYLLRKNQNA